METIKPKDRKKKRKAVESLRDGILFATEGGYATLFNF